MRPVAMPPAFVSIINFANVNSIQLNQIEFRQSQEGPANYCCHKRGQTFTIQAQYNALHTD